MIVASSFRKDSLSHWQRFRILRNTRPALLPQRPVGSKLFVDLLFCSECALKSLVVSLSAMSETPEDAFKKAKALSHRVSDLAREVRLRAPGRLRFIGKQKLAVLAAAQAVG